MKFKITADKSVINIPVKNGAAMRLMRVLVDGHFGRYFSVELADGEPDFWCFIDAAEWKGKTVEIEPADSSTPVPALHRISLEGTIREAETHYGEPRRPHFHFTSRRGWLNDPNGLVFYHGEYHLFYQHNPFGIGFTNQHWGHAVSRDLVQWSELPPALAPDALGTIWSGSAVVDWHNSSGFQTTSEPPLVLIYTAGPNSCIDPGAPCVQCLAFSNDRGRTWTKYSGNPMLPAMSPGNRDPKVIWHEGVRQWVMVLYITGNDYGFLASADLKKWELLHTITLPECSECPDFFEMPVAGSQERKWVFTAAKGTYLVGSFDGRKFVPEQKPAPMYGNGNYAVQTFSDVPGGRRVQIAWMTRGQVPPYDLAFLHTEFSGCPFKCNMSFPCELTLRQTPDGWRIWYEPVHELELLHGTVFSESAAKLASTEVPMADPGGPLRITAAFESGTASEFGLDIRNIRIGYDARRGVLSASGSGSEIPVTLEDGRLRLEILVDTCSIECFINGGRGYLPLSVLSRDMKVSGIKAFATAGDARLTSARIISLKSAWKPQPE